MRGNGFGYKYVIMCNFSLPLRVRSLFTDIFLGVLTLAVNINGCIIKPMCGLLVVIYLRLTDQVLNSWRFYLDASPISSFSAHIYLVLLKLQDNLFHYSLKENSLYCSIGSTSRVKNNVLSAKNAIPFSFFSANLVQTQGYSIIEAQYNCIILWAFTSWDL